MKFWRKEVVTASLLADVHTTVTVAGRAKLERTGLLSVRLLPQAGDELRGHGHGHVPSNNRPQHGLTLLCRLLQSAAN